MSWTTTSRERNWRVGYPTWTAASLAYDAAGRLRETVGSGVTTRFLYDGVDMIAEYNSSNVLQRRYVHGPGMDEPLVWYEGAGTADRRYLITDQLGSVVAANGNASTTINAYDEFGQPSATNTGRFQYTGQMWLNEAQLYHYKARAYLPQLGRFAQSDDAIAAVTPEHEERKCLDLADGVRFELTVGVNPRRFSRPVP